MDRWRIESLGNLCSQEPGAIAIGPFGSRMKSDCYTDFGTPVIRGTNIADGRSWKGDWVFVSDEFASTMPNCLTRPGDLVFPHRGSIGEVGIIPHDNRNYIISTSLMKFRPNKQIASSLFLFYYFRSKMGRGEILKYSSQVGTPGIGQPLASLRQFKVPCPPLSEQKTIASILGSLDDKIDLNRRMNETLEAMARAIFKDWFVDFGPTRAKMEGRAPYLAQEIWDLFPDSLDDEGKPVGWRMVSIGEIADLGWGDTNTTKSSYTQRGYIAFSASGPDGYLSYFDFDRKGVVLSAIGANCGKTWFATGKWSCIKNTIRFWSTCDDISDEYLYMQTACDSFWPRRGSAQPFISQTDARICKIIRPQGWLAKVYGDVVGNFFEMMLKNKEQSRTLAQTRDLLLPKLMSGEIRVKDAEKAVGAVL